MSTFTSANDESIAGLIDNAKRKVVFIAPGVGLKTVNAFKRAIDLNQISLNIIIDSDEDACRIGYGDHKALSKLQEIVHSNEFPLRREPGLRIGLLVSDDELTIWAPTALSVEPASKSKKPNAIHLTGPVIENVEAAAGADNSQVLPTGAEIGQKPLLSNDLKETVDKLNANPPAPFDLSQKARVFSTRYQFVEFEVRGAAWTGKTIKLSNLLLNADLPEELQDILETRVAPFQKYADMAFDIPYFVNGEAAYKHDGTRMTVPAKQADIQEQWLKLRNHYLTQLKGFGWLIEKKQLASFQAGVKAHEEVLAAWVTAFRKYAEAEDDNLVESIVNSISARLERSDKPMTPDSLEQEVKAGLQRMKVVEPKVRIVTKNVSWESSRDQEFQQSMRQAFTPDELKGWFDEFTAVKQQEPHC